MRSASAAFSPASAPTCCWPAMGCNASAQTVVPDDAPKPQQYQWYWQCWDEKVEYPADVRDRLEKAYTEFKAGRGPTYPTVAVGGDCEVSLKTMTSRHARTGVQRDVVREHQRAEEIARDVHAEVDLVIKDYKIQAKIRKSIASYLLPNENVDAQVIRQNRGEAYIVLRLEDWLKQIQ